MRILPSELDVITCWTEWTTNFFMVSEVRSFGYLLHFSLQYMWFFLVDLKNIILIVITKLYFFCSFQFQASFVHIVQ